MDWRGFFSERTLSLLMNSINQVPQKKIQTNKLLRYRIIFLLLNVIKVANVLCLSYIIASLAMKCKQLDTGPKQNKIQVLNKKCTCYKMALTRNECWSIGVLVRKYFPPAKKSLARCTCTSDTAICSVKCNIKSYSPVYYDILMVHFEMYENILYLFIIWGFS